NEEELLYTAYKNSLVLAEQNQVQAIAFPNISTGIYGFPKEKAAEIAIKIVKDFLNTSHYVNKVFFVCFDEKNYNIYNTLLK
ncbi:MAG TPA: RNase III inhibitor, partial [Bacteroidetes bacterium]|nr:RNase III inhibitor [Bacteroidota bacterium]